MAVGEEGLTKEWVQILYLKLGEWPREVVGSSYEVKDEMVAERLVDVEEDVAEELVVDDDIMDVDDLQQSWEGDMALSWGFGRLK